MSETDAAYVQYLVKRGVCTITLDRPRQRNPLSSEMIAAVHNAVTLAAASADVSVVIIAANGSVFSAGHDLKQMYQDVVPESSAHRAQLTELVVKCNQMMLAIRQCPKPVIASVQGTATAAGCQLVAICDLAVAASTASFCTPGVNIGTLCTTPLVPIARNIQPKHAMEMALTGDMYSAADAASMGLINRSVAPQDLTDTVNDLALKIAAKSSAGIALGKAAFYEQIEMPLVEAFDYAAEAMVKVLTEPDAYQGVAEFFSKK